ncbi:sensor histidine kinase [Ramlibacter humi]|uniref:histidine kinase n=1 Tax=Ramlibacter humi TaxID=2530451 RepID=A0A4Z0BCZ2_9BURK|nr:DUF4118 domain-containing protein [Ramlibacter humi]TFY96157.1 DUF4118 domain-containing protein [Ramlibacter humi]
MKRRTPALHWLLAAAVPAAATAACHALDGRMSLAGLAMVYLVAVVVTALALDRGAALLASLLSVAALNFFFVPPQHSFRVDGAESWWMLAVLLGLSVALQSLIASLREKRVQAELAHARAAELHALGEALAACRGHEAMALEAARFLEASLRRPCAVFLREGEGLRRIGGDPAAAWQPSAAEWALAHGRVVGRGCDDWPDLALWCAPFHRDAPLGAMQWLLPSDGRPSEETRLHWQALARQAGLAIEREYAAESARQAQDSAHAEAARNTLLASLSHDLRTPLAGILGSASALRTHGADLPPAERDRLLAGLEDEARDLSLMADNILQMARLSQPTSQLRLQWESAEEILGATVARMRRRWPHARIELKVAPGLPPLRAEAGLLAQLVANLVDNAVRHGGSRPHVVLRAGRGRDGLFLAVRDHGEGLPAGDPQALFSRFGQSQRDGASGLGLALCRLIAQAHGGTIEARRCEPGAEFRVDLPVPEKEGTV